MLSSAAGTAGPTGDTLAVSVPSTTTAQGGTVALDANGDGGFTYTPPASFTGTDTFTYTVTDTSDGAGDYATGTASVEVLAPAPGLHHHIARGPVRPAPTTRPWPPPGALRPTPGRSSSGSLPPGLGLSSSGVLSGTPTAAGTFSFSVKATDSTTPTALSATQALSLTVAPAPLSITASSPAMTYGGAVPAITAYLLGLRQRGHGRLAHHRPQLLDYRHQLLPRGQLPLHLLGGRGRQLRHQLHRRLGQHRPGPAQHHRLQPGHDLWRGGTGHHPYLQRAGGRRHGGLAPHRPQLLDHRYQLVAPGHLPLDVFGGRGRQLRHQL